MVIQVNGLIFDTSQIIYITEPIVAIKDGFGNFNQIVEPVESKKSDEKEEEEDKTDITKYKYTRIVLKDAYDIKPIELFSTDFGRFDNIFSDILNSWSNGQEVPNYELKG